MTAESFRATANREDTDVIGILEGVAGISFTFFSPRDVVRHSLVQRIVEAYERHQGDEQ